MADADRGGGGGGAGGDAARNAKRQCVRPERQLLEVAVVVGRGYADNGEDRDAKEVLRRAGQGLISAQQRWQAAHNEYMLARCDPRSMPRPSVREIELAAAGQNLQIHRSGYEEAQENVRSDEHEESMRRAENNRCAACAENTEHLCVVLPCQHMLVCSKCAEQLKLGTHFTWTNKCPECQVGVTSWLQPTRLTHRQTQNCLEEAVEGPYPHGH